MEKREIHYTPKHGSGLNVAEIELSILARQCLDRCIASWEKLAKEVAAVESASTGVQMGGIPPPPA